MSYSIGFDITSIKRNDDGSFTAEIILPKGFDLVTESQPGIEIEDFKSFYVSGILFSSQTTYERYRDKEAYDD